jgi:hypothetical protein
MSRRFAFLAAFALLTAAQAQVVVGPVMNPTNGKRYYRLAPTTWADANARAAALGGSLATIHDSATNEWVRANVAAFGRNTSECFIGVNDLNTENFYSWIGGDPAVWFNWAPGEPNNTNGLEDLGAMNPSSGLWNDRGDWAVLPAIVEVEGDIRVPTEYPTIQAAINAARDGQVITVLPGNYTGSFDLGFKKLIVRSADGPAVTTISTTNPTFGIILAGGQGPETVLEGFTIVSAGTPADSQIAIFDGQTIRNCRIAGARVGIYASKTATVSDCVITEALYGILLTPLNRPMDVVIQNCTIAGVGLGVATEGSPAGRYRATVRNSIIQAYGPIADRAPQSTIAFEYCNTVGAMQPGPGNFSQQPQFLNAPGSDNLYDRNDDYRLSPLSPCIDRGSTFARVGTANVSVQRDAGGELRFVDAEPVNFLPGIAGVVDVGAFEHNPTVPICAIDFNGDGFVDFFDYDAFVQGFEEGC